jgi:hypothetical protein
LLTLGYASIAKADGWTGRAEFSGYFSNLGEPPSCPYSMRGANNCGGADDNANLALPSDGSCGGSPDALPAACINSVTSLVDLLKRYNAASDERLHASSAFIVQTMLGRDGNQANANGGRNISAADWAEVTRRLNAAQSQGLIHWNEVTTTPDRTYAVYNPTQNNGDVTHYSGDPQTDPAIVIYDSGGFKRYVLFRPCANPGGSLLGLVAANYGLTASLVPGAGTPPFTTGPNNGIIQPGVQYYLTPKVTNPDNTNAEAFYMEIESLNPAYVVNAGFARPGGQDTGGSYRASGCSSGVDPCWDWAYGSGLAGPSTSVQTDGASFTIRASAPQGTRVCFRLEVRPSDPSGGTLDVPSASGSYCFLVYSPVYPTVVGNSGDVHAGGGICGTMYKIGSVTGNVNAVGSRGAYVVSANSPAGIDDFGSNNADTSTVLNLGKTGRYSSICREDLWRAAQGYMGGFATIPAGSHDVGNPSEFNPAYDVYFASGTISLHGVISRKMTIVGSLGGDINIDGPLTIDNSTPYTRQDLPSLGLISHGNINMHAKDSSGAFLTQVSAYMFADGNIDTCVEADARCETPPLVINGFLMAGGLRFHRLGPSGARGAQMAEEVNLNPQIYLNPPKLFDASIDGVLLNGQGEGRPLF